MVGVRLSACILQFMSGQSLVSLFQTQEELPIPRDYGDLGAFFLFPARARIRRTFLGETFNRVATL